VNTTTNMMERRVKERLVGATILVALIVLIVPELLSGPKRAALPPLAQDMPASTRSVTVDLSTNRTTPSGGAATAAADPGGAPPAGVAAAPGNDGAPAAASTAGGGTGAAGADASGDLAATPEPPPQENSPTVTTLRAQEPAGPALDSRGPPPRSGSSAGPVPVEAPQPHHVWAVQLGSFASKVNAEKLAHQLQARGGPGVYIVSSGAGSSLRYRVRMGPLGDRSAAERAAAKLKAAGHPATIVTPTS